MGESQPLDLSIEHATMFVIWLFLGDVVDTMIILNLIFWWWL